MFFHFAAILKNCTPATAYQEKSRTGIFNAKLSPVMSEVIWYLAVAIPVRQFSYTMQLFPCLIKNQLCNQF